MARETPLAKNWTLATVPSVSAAVAVTVLEEPTPTVAALSGEVTLTEGEELAATVMLLAVLVAWLPAESMTSAVSE